MSGYPPYGNPQYPPPQGQLYPQLYNAPTAPSPPNHPAAMSYPAPPGQYPVPGQNPHQYQPGVQYALPGQPMPTQYAGYGIAPTPSAPYGFAPVVTPQGQARIEWIPSTPSAAVAYTDRAIVAGYEGHDHSPLWVIRARHQGDLIPGKLAIAHRAAYVSYGGDEHGVHSFEVLCARPECVRWVEMRGDNQIPHNAIPGGNTSSGETLYIGRAQEQGSLTPGKVHPSHRVLYMSFGGKEIPHQNFEILCTV